MFDKAYWDNKWAKDEVIYNGRALRGSSERIQVDVRNFVIANDYILSRIIKENNLIGSTYNETAHRCQKFVVNTIKYVSDDEQNTCPEFWQFPFETLASKRADCEDGSILMASLMIVAGIPNYRVKVAAGYVQPEPTAPQGGHAYCIYLADMPNGEQEFVIMDWCYYEDSALPPCQKPLAKNGGYNGTYQDIWFTFNNEYSWSEGPVEINSNRVR